MQLWVGCIQCARPGRMHLHDLILTYASVLMAHGWDPCDNMPAQSSRCSSASPGGGSDADETGQNTAITGNEGHAAWCLGDCSAHELAGKCYSCHAKLSQVWSASSHQVIEPSMHAQEPP